MNPHRNNDRVSILLTGFGLIGSKHAEMVSAREDCILAAIVAPHCVEYEKKAAEYGTRLYSTIQEAFDSVHIDAAIISSPNEFHYEQALACLDKKIPVLVEKPLTDDLDMAKHLVEVVADTKVPLLVGHHRTYSPLLSTALDFLKSDRFGKMVAVQGAALFYKPKEYYEAGPWRTKPGGGPILINLIHEIGIMRHLCGEIVKVSAFESRKNREFEVEDTVTINFVFENGVLGNFLLSDAAASNKSWEMTSGENPAYPHYPTQACYHFVGSNGSIDFPNMHTRYYLDTEGASWWRDFVEERLVFTPIDPLECQLSHFIKVIRGDESPIVTAMDGYMNMVVVDAIKESIQTEKIVEISQTYS